MRDERTDNLKLPLPHADNDLSDDVERIRTCFARLDGELGTGIQAKLETVREEAAAAAAEARGIAEDALAARAVVLSPPTVILPDILPIGAEVVVSLWAGDAGITDVAAFHVTDNDGAGREIPADGGAAQWTITPSGDDGGAYAVSVVAEDALGNRSAPAEAAGTLRAAPMIRARIVSPANGERSVAPSPVIRVAPMQADGGEDTPAGLRVQIARHAGFAEDSIVWDSGEIPPPDDNAVACAAVLPPRDICYIRARWTGRKNGPGMWSPPHRVAILGTPVIAACQTAIGAAGQTWTYLDDTLLHALPEKPSVAGHPTYAGIREEIIDGQHMVGIPKFFCRRETLAHGDFVGKDCRAISSIALPGYEVHPAFLAHGGDTALERIWIGKYQATQVGSAGKMDSLPAGMVASIQNLAKHVAAATLRNAGGVDGFHVWNIHELAAIQLLMILEYGGTDFQELIGPGFVGHSSAYNGDPVDSDEVATASWRGITGLWGNKAQVCNGLRIPSGQLRLQVDMAYGWFTTTIFGSALSTGYPNRMHAGSGEGWSIDHLFIGSREDVEKNTSENAAYPDYQRWPSSAQSGGDVVITVGGGGTVRTDIPGPFYVEILGASSPAATRLAKW